MVFVCLLPDFDMKKDIDTLIAEERAEIISKYDRVSVHAGIPSPNPENAQTQIMHLRFCNLKVRGTAVRKSLHKDDLT